MVKLLSYTYDAPNLYYSPAPTANNAMQYITIIIIHVVTIDDSIIFLYSFQLIVSTDLFLFIQCF